MELAINAFCHWFRPFATNMWCILDTFIVAMSLVSTALTSKPTGIVRALRALRVIPPCRGPTQICGMRKPLDRAGPRQSIIVMAVHVLFV